MKIKATKRGWKQKKNKMWLHYCPIRAPHTPCIMYHATHCKPHLQFGLPSRKHVPPLLYFLFTRQMLWDSLKCHCIVDLIIFYALKNQAICCVRLQEISFNNQSPTFTLVLWKLFCVFLFVYIVHVHVLHSYPLNVCSCFRRRLLTSAPIAFSYFSQNFDRFVAGWQTSRCVCSIVESIASLSSSLHKKLGTHLSPFAHIFVSNFCMVLYDFYFVLCCSTTYNPILLLFCFVVSSTFATYIMKSYFLCFGL